jgi:hypothetical protein
MNQPYKQYNIIYDSYFPELIEKVNTALQDGWEPLGAVVILETESGTEYYQTLGLRTPRPGPAKGELWIVDGEGRRVG